MLERAFELARTGVLKNPSDITRQLRAEGYDVRQVEGPTLLKQLRAAIKRATDGGGTPNQSGPGTS